MTLRSRRGRRWSRGSRALVLSLPLLTALTACRSAYVEADLQNASGQPVTIVEVDYPSASFGTDALAAGATFHYRFKILGSGATKVSWTDSAHKDHSVPGPELHEGQAGHMQVTIAAQQDSWSLQLQP